MAESGGRNVDRADSGGILSLALSTPRLPQHTRAPQASALASALFHGLLITTLALIAARSTIAPESPSPEAAASAPMSLPRMVFLLNPGPGGGGGNRRPEPPPRAQSIGHDRLTFQVARPVAASPAPTDAPRPSQQVVLDAAPLASGTTYQIRLPEASPSSGLSGGPGSGGGVGDGIGTGVRSGTGPGVGPGSGGGFGGGAYRPGGGVVPPTLLKDVKPKYTDSALERRLQGTVALEVVVTGDGVPGAIRVTRSLDPGGLDEEAIQAVREWRFNPGRLGVTPVDVLITIFLDFRIH